MAKEMYPGCEVLTDYKELYNKTDIDLVVNDTYSDLHFPITKELLEHKFNVLCEKPMAGTRFECEDLIKTAKDNGVKVFVFQQTFFFQIVEHTTDVAVYRSDDTQIVTHILLELPFGQCLSGELVFLEFLLIVLGQKLKIACKILIHHLYQ